MILLSVLPITCILFVFSVSAWKVELDFEGGRKKVYEEVRREANHTQLPEGILPAYDEKCIDVWSEDNRHHIDDLILSGSRDPSSLSTNLTRYSFTASFDASKPGSHTLFLYPDEKCKSQTPDTATKKSKASSFNTTLNWPFAVLDDTHGGEGITLSEPKEVKSFYVSKYKHGHKGHEEEGGVIGGLWNAKEKIKEWLKGKGELKKEEDEEGEGDERERKRKEKESGGSRVVVPLEVSWWWVVVLLVGSVFMLI